MTANFALKDWLAEIGVAGEDLALIETKLTPHAGKIGEGVLRQADYSRALNEIDATKTQLRAENDRLAAEAAEWAELTAAERQNAAGQRQQLEATQTRVAALTNRIKTIAANAGITEAQALEGIETVNTPPPATPPGAPDPAVHDARFDQFGRQLSGIAAMSLTLPAELQEIAQDHRELTGTRLDTRAIVAEIQKRAGTRGNQKSLDPHQVWEELHNIPAKRAEKEQERINGLVAAAREEGRTQGLSEASLPTGSNEPRHSPALMHAAASASKLQRPQPQTAISGAVAAFQSHKYRPADGRQGQGQGRA